MTVPIVALNRSNKINQESCLASDIYPIFIMMIERDSPDPIAREMLSKPVYLLET